MVEIHASPEMLGYVERFRRDCFKAFEIAQKARELGYDPENEVSVTLAETLAERVIGLISVIAPQIKNAGVEKRIEDLEAKYGILDWRIALQIALEIAQQKFCMFKDELEAITVGIRVGFAYVTLGVVSAPLEGLTSVELKDRLDGQGKYFCLNFAGPIRNAGGTAAAVCVIVGDYVRKKMGYATYDPTEKEMKRCPAELEDYHEWITNLQYFPSKEESIFMMEHLPVEIGGDASEKYEVSNINLKDLPRIPVNQLRSGYCLIHSSCIPLKAAKLWKNLEKWGKDFDMEHWNFLKEFLALQKKMKAAGKKVESTAKITPDYTYIKDLVAGRPVLAYPLRPGGFRLRYGRSRASGYSGQAIHPCTMHVLNNYIASATQLKVERPGKAAAFMPCDSIEGPIVKLKDGRVMQLQDEEIAKKVAPQVEKILYLGDVLINYGDFFDRNHSLVPAGYCPEWWIQEVERSITSSGREWNPSMLSEVTGLDESRCMKLINEPMRSIPSVEEAITIAQSTATPLHSAWTYFWSLITAEQLKLLLNAIIIKDGRVVFIKEAEVKNVLEKLGIPHAVDGYRKSEVPNPETRVSDGTIIIDKDHDKALLFTLGLERMQPTDALTMVERIPEGERTLDIVSSLAGVQIRDKAGTFIGSRMGRPEKAKMRKLTGSPHTLFPVGEEGGRLRSIQEALSRGKITAEYPIRFCQACQLNTIFQRCEMCDGWTEQRTVERHKYGQPDTPPDILTYARQDIEIRRIFDACLKKLKFRIYPDLIKGVRGTSNKSHIPEHLIKGILRAKNDVSVNKDGTVRYDCSEVTLTHFTPREAHVSVEKLLDLGYTHDAKGRPLVHEDQVLELRPQDILIPCCPDSPDEPADEILFRVGNFIDELLMLLYGQEPYYNFKSKEDVVGQYVVGLAPHTSAGIVGRVVGFSKTQGFLAHPLYHAAMRRDCDGDESCISLLMDVFLNFSSKFLPETRGSTMDAPLVLTYFLNPAEVDDMAFHVDTVWKYPLAMYEAALEYKKPGEIKIPMIGDHLGTPAQFEGMGYTHDTTSLNAGVLCSAYKILPSMEEKLFGQMDLAVKISACDQGDVAKLVIEKHFMRDTKGNLRKFTQQEYRCVTCNEKFRRPPLIGKCTACNGKVVFTISEGSVIKYLQPSLDLCSKYGIEGYLKQDLELLARKIDDLFGRDPEKQTGLGDWF
jgi:DNA polymerase II large subunit